jgi:DNA polymerase III delta prime subunit
MINNKSEIDKINLSFFEDNPDLDELDFKSIVLDKFKNLDIESLPNLLFYGPTSCGKTTKIYALLASLLNKKVYDLRNVEFEDDRKTLNYKSSIYHIEINALNIGSNEKIFIQSFLKSYVETRNIGLDIPKIILIKNANNLSKQGQLSLRRIIERNFTSAKFIFEVSSLSNFCDPLLSRCLIIRIKHPSIDEVKIAIKRVSNKNNFEISDEKIDYIIKESNKIDYSINLKKIFGFYRYFLITNKNFKFEYYDKFEEILNFIIGKKFLFSNIQKIRDLINEMYISTISMEELLIFIHNKLCDFYKDNSEIVFKIIEISTECDILLKTGNKECLHLEYYIVSLLDFLSEANTKVTKPKKIKK